MVRVLREYFQCAVNRLANVNIAVDVHVEGNESDGGVHVLPDCMN